MASSQTASKNGKNSNKSLGGGKSPGDPPPPPPPGPTDQTGIGTSPDPVPATPKPPRVYVRKSVGDIQLQRLELARDDMSRIVGDVHVNAMVRAITLQINDVHSALSSALKDPSVRIIDRRGPVQLEIGMVVRLTEAAGKRMEMPNFEGKITKLGESVAQAQDQSGLVIALPRGSFVPA